MENTITICNHIFTIEKQAPSKALDLGLPVYILRGKHRQPYRTERNVNNRSLMFIRNLKTLCCPFPKIWLTDKDGTLKTQQTITVNRRNSDLSIFII